MMCIYFFHLHLYKQFYCIFKIGIVITYQCYITYYNVYFDISDTIDNNMFTKSDKKCIIDSQFYFFDILMLNNSRKNYK